jgi:hypothetical protein
VDRDFPGSGGTDPGRHDRGVLPERLRIAGLANAGRPGLWAPSKEPQVERDLLRGTLEARDRSELEKRLEVGGPLEAAIRALLYVRLPEGSADERGLAMFRLIRAAQPPDKRVPMAQLKKTLKEQFLIVTLDEQRAIQAIPRLLPRNVEERRAALEVLHCMLGARGALSEQASLRLNQVEALFEVKGERSFKAETAHA